MITIVSCGDYGYVAVDEDGNEWGRAGTAKRAHAIATKKLKRVRVAPDRNERPADVPQAIWDVCQFNEYRGDTKPRRGKRGFVRAEGGASTV